jgi:hypothetical protein
VVSVTPGPRFAPRGKDPRYPLDRRLVGLDKPFISAGDRTHHQEIFASQYKFLVSQRLAVLSIIINPMIPHGGGVSWCLVVSNVSRHTHFLHQFLVSFPTVSISRDLLL